MEAVTSTYCIVGMFGRDKVWQIASSKVVGEKKFGECLQQHFVANYYHHRYYRYIVYVIMKWTDEWKGLDGLSLANTLLFAKFAKLSNYMVLYSIEKVYYGVITHIVIAVLCNYALITLAKWLLGLACIPSHKCSQAKNWCKCLRVCAMNFNLTSLVAVFSSVISCFLFIIELLYLSLNNSLVLPSNLFLSA